MDTRITICLTDGVLRGASHVADNGLPTELDLSALSALAPEINAAALARITELEAELAAALAAPQADPTTIRAWQAKAVLALAGLLDAAESIIAALPEPDRTVVLSAWSNNADFSRTSPTIAALGSALGLTDEQLDAMFTQAAALTV